MRILIASHGHPALRTGGGEIFSHDLFRALRSRGEDAFFLACALPVEQPAGGNPGITPFGDSGSEWLYHIPPYDYFLGSPRDSALLHTGFAQFLRDLKPDVVHFHHFFLIGTEALAVVKATLPGCRLLLTLHEYMAICHEGGQMVRPQDQSLCDQASPERCHECFPDIAASRFGQREAGFRQFFSHVDLFICPSRFLRDRYAQWGLPAEKLHHLPNGINVPDAPESGSQPAARNRFGFFGQFTTLKGVEVLLDAASMLTAGGDTPTFEVHIHGTFGMQMPEHVKKLTAHIESTPCVRYHGAYRHEEVLEKMSGVDWVVVPSIWWENHPLTIEEAYAARRPVLCSDIGGMAESVRNGRDGLHFRTGDAGSLAMAMRHCLEHPERWLELSARMRRARPMRGCVDEHLGLYRGSGKTNKDDGKRDLNKDNNAILAYSLGKLLIVRWKVATSRPQKFSLFFKNKEIPRPYQGIGLSLGSECLVMAYLQDAIHGGGTLEVRDDTGASWGKRVLRKAPPPFDAVTLSTFSDADQGRIRKGFLEILPGTIPDISAAQLRINSALFPDASANTEAAPDGNKQTLRARIEKFDLFTIRGWVAVSNDARIDIEVRHQGQTVPVDVILGRREDIAGTPEAKGNCTGYEIILPGYIWETAGDGPRCEISLYANGRLITPRPLVLTPAVVESWTRRGGELENATDRQFYSLLAIEHIRYARLLPVLSPKVAGFIAKIARIYGLEDFLYAEPADGEHSLHAIAPGVKPAEDATTLTVWKTLRAFNARLTPEMPAGEKFRCLQEALEESALGTDARERLLLLLIPFFCNTPHLRSLAGLVNLGHLRAHVRSENAWALSLSLPLLLEDGQLTEAIGILQKLAKDSSGSLNAGCVLHATRNVMGDWHDGKLRGREMEQFVVALLRFYTSIAPDWFSRLYDRSLIAAMMCLLSESPGFPDPLRRETIIRAIRYYGLCPAFWEQFNQLPESLRERLDGEIGRAQSQFQALTSAINVASAENARLAACESALLYFYEIGNEQSLQWTRELLLNAWEGLNASGGPLLAGLARTLLGRASEAMRLLAYPLTGESRLLLEAPYLARLVGDNLRAHPDRPHSPVSVAQLSAAIALGKLKADAGGELTEPHVQELLKLARVLGDRQGHFLTFDVLADAWLALPANNQILNEQRFIRELTLSLGMAIEETHADAHLPPTLLAGLARLSMRQDDASEPFRAFLTMAHGNIEAKFGARHSPALEPVRSPVMELPTRGNPGDVLVVIYSCRKYLDSRIPAIRNTWARDLNRRGIPYVVLVGDGDDTLQGDVLALDVSDLYEDLPKKSLRMLEWAFSNTRAQYLVKVDDDCLLDVDRYFDSLSYRRHHYYGRVLKRPAGNIDRLWHHAKSRSAHAMKSIDKSPEPSSYADGGGGWCMSRLAMATVLQNVRTPAGQRLLNCSFMEDKLMGDLLSMSHIRPSDEDYITLQRRRTFAEAVPVNQWENTFLPSSISPTKMAHLDTEKDMEQAWLGRHEASLSPKRIWMTWENPQVGLNKNQLELLSSTEKLAALLKEDLLVVSVVRNEIVMLPHFLRHYRDLGVKAFIFTDNLSDDGSREFLLTQPDVALYSADTEYKLSHYGVAWQQAILGNHCLGKWVLLADADELLVFEDSGQRKLPDFVAGLEGEGADASITYMIDMYPFGDLEDADFTKQTPFEAAPWFDRFPLIEWHLDTGWFDNSRVFTSAARHRMVPDSIPSNFVSQKYCLFRYQPWVRLSEGLHYAANLRVAASPTWFAHFKYHAGFKKKIETEIRRGQHFNNADEYRRYAVMLAETAGKFGNEESSSQFHNSLDYRKIGF